MSTEFNVRGFGAQGDGVALDTAAVQRAIDAAAEAGGRVAVPAGTYRCGTIFLRSRVTLDLQPGARILGSTDLADYHPRVWGHHKDITPWHLLVAEDCEHVALTGEGEIDGNGPAFWKPDRPHQWHFWSELVHRPSPMVELKNCRHVRIENVTLRNSAGWTLHLHDCDHTSVRGITIRNTLFGPNTDGIDITGCKYLTISDCNIETGDDAIAMKTTKYSRSCEYIAVTNCVLRTSCVAVRIGAESVHAFRYITVTNCVVPSCSRMIDIRSFEGGDHEHIVISNLAGTTNSGWPVNRPIELALHRVENKWDSSRPPEHPDYGTYDAVARAGRMRDITLRDIDILTDGRVTIVADDDAWMGDVLIANLRLRYVLLEDTAQPRRSGKPIVHMPNGHLDACAARAAIVAKNVHNLRIKSLSVRWPEYPVPDWWDVLKTPNRVYNDGFYLDREEEIRTGRYRVPFSVLWGRNLRGGFARLKGATPSDEGAPLADLRNCDFTME